MIAYFARFSASAIVLVLSNSSFAYDKNSSFVPDAESIEIWIKITVVIHPLQTMQIESYIQTVICWIQTELERRVMYWTDYLLTLPKKFQHRL